MRDVKPIGISGIKREYRKDEMKEIEKKNKHKNIRNLCRGIIELEKAYQIINNFVKKKNGDLLADSRNILKRWKSYFC
jgi:hypothetical protein